MTQKRAQPRRSPRTIGRVEIDFLVLADFAQAVQGKLHMIGAGWNVCTLRQFPAVVQFGLGIGILVPWSLTNRRFDFGFEIRASEGNVRIANGNGQFEVGRPPGLPPGMTQRVVIGLSGQMQLPQPGTYEVSLTTEGAEKTVVFEALTPLTPQ